MEFINKILFKLMNKDTVNVFKLNFYFYCIKYACKFFVEKCPHNIDRPLYMKSKTQFKIPSK